MQSKFQNKVVLPKKDTLSPLYKFREHVFSSTSINQTFTDLGKGSLPISQN
jgi:hypothetical protein